MSTPVLFTSRLATPTSWHTVRLSSEAWSRSLAPLQQRPLTPLARLLFMRALWCEAASGHMALGCKRWGASFPSTRRSSYDAARNAKLCNADQSDHILLKPIACFGPRMTDQNQAGSY
eukprot:14028-Amphidinium_carterae.1